MADLQWWQEIGDRLLVWLIRSYLVMIILGVVVGLQVAPVAIQSSPRPESGEVVVISLEGGIDGANAASVLRRLTQARQDPDPREAAAVGGGQGDP